MFLVQEYGVLFSVRHQARKTNELINSITTKFGIRIEWNDRTGWNIISVKQGEHALFFRRRGNKFANYLELLCSDIDLLSKVKDAFPDDFKADLKIEEGIL